jgi:hypothetical protein
MFTKAGTIDPKKVMMETKKEPVTICHASSLNLCCVYLAAKIIKQEPKLIIKKSV